MTFEIYTEDGMEKLEYQDYLKRSELMEQLQDNRRFFLNLGLKLFSFDRAWMAEHSKESDYLQGLYHEWEINPLRFFLPHCANNSDFNTSSHKFINNSSHIYNGLIGPNRFGKSTIAFIKALTTGGVIPCDPNWEIFKDHGVKFREWTGPKEIAFATYNLGNIQKTLWPQITRFWTPKAELGEKFSSYTAPQDRAFTVPLACGSIIHMMCMAQPQTLFESQALHGVLWDEQGTEAKFDGANARMQTLRSYSKDEDGKEYLTAGWHICAATPHKVEGRADTGGGTWFQGMYDGTVTKGLTVAFYKGSVIDDVPDWIFPEREKKVKLKELEEAIETNNAKAERAIRSRLFGDFETTGGMVYDEWDDSVHVIHQGRIEDSWCAFRCMDHGRTNPTSCVWVAITPDDEYIAFREYLKPDQVISENVKQIVKLSRNTLLDRGTVRMGEGMFSRYQEVVVDENSEQYIFDVIDGRSFRNPDTNSRYTIGDIYKLSGLNRLRPAPMQSIESTIPIVKELLKIDPTRKHLITGKMGAPRLYISSDCKNLIKHIKGYRNKETKDGVSEKPSAKDDHDLDALRYGFSMGPRYNVNKPIRPKKALTTKSKGRGYWINEEKPHTRRGGRDPFTGY